MAYHSSAEPTQPSRSALSRASIFASCCSPSRLNTSGTSLSPRVSCSRKNRETNASTLSENASSSASVFAFSDVKGSANRRLAVRWSCVHSRCTTRSRNCKRSLTLSSIMSVEYRWLLPAHVWARSLSLVLPVRYQHDVRSSFGRFWRQVVHSAQAGFSTS